MPNDIEAAAKFLKDNNFDFNNPELMHMALMHPSYSQEKNSTANNQRLEFLGDAVLNFIVAEYIYKHYQDKPEGDLTKIRAKVVCEKSLVKVAQKVNLGEYMLLGRGEEMSGGRKRKSILADAVEAVIGAIYLDQGYETARDFVLLHLKDYIEESANGDYYDYKSRLQEIVQAYSNENVSYRIVSESGPAHAKSFVAGVFFRGEMIATGEGRSKKEAEQNAAGKVLKEDLLSKFIAKKGK